ncbi:XRE family transcriptional regulator [Lactobacillus sanfranciscensis]|uniref:helix-turn-helix domain-containing protein n=1 Tax=Fructilactobacillus sanfranciscensis TaxID=1625 RepID=UPI000CD46F19|nr:XRE family transcriptional regulator [Fructilactobacillus sanfranciscensis]NDS16601.1 XRE family transcriptional regulator [Fructilactobacillus sanfranciscensis]
MRKTQSELADQLLISSKTISNWETGKTIPDLENETSRQEVKNINTEYIGETIEDFDKWAEKV